DARLHVGNRAALAQHELVGLRVLDLAVLARGDRDVDEILGLWLLAGHGRPRSSLLTHDTELRVNLSRGDGWGRAGEPEATEPLQFQLGLQLDMQLEGDRGAFFPLQVVDV